MLDVLFSIASSLYRIYWLIWLNLSCYCTRNFVQCLTSVGVHAWILQMMTVPLALLLCLYDMFPICHKLPLDIIKTMMCSVLSLFLTGTCLHVAISESLRMAYMLCLHLMTGPDNEEVDSYIGRLRPDQSVTSASHRLAPRNAPNRQATNTTFPLRSTGQPVVTRVGDFISDLFSRRDDNLATPRFNDHFRQNERRPHYVNPVARSRPLSPVDANPRRAISRSNNYNRQRTTSREIARMKYPALQQSSIRSPFKFANLATLEDETKEEGNDQIRETSQMSRKKRNATKKNNDNQ